MGTIERIFLQDDRGDGTFAKCLRTRYGVGVSKEEVFEVGEPVFLPNYERVSDTGAWWIQGFQNEQGVKTALCSAQRAGSPGTIYAACFELEKLNEMERLAVEYSTP